MAIQLPYPYPDLTSQQWDAFALLSNLEFLASKLTAIQTGQLMPVGAIVMFSAGSTCPAGYNKVTDAALASRYLRINISAGGATGGSSSAVVTDPGHVHGVGTYAIGSGGSHTHNTGTPSSTVNVQSGSGVTVASSTHIHSITSSGAHTHLITGSAASSTTHVTATVTPPFLEIILCQKT
jgi:hypothetical protein